MNDEKFAGFGEKGGIGERIGILVIDFMNAFTNKNHPLGSDLDKEIAATKHLLTVARKEEVPIFFTTVAYEPHFKDGANFIRKVPALKALTLDSDGPEIDERLERSESTEPLIMKKFASAFFGTALFSMLTDARIDTIVLVGCSTSGCVRATAVDGLQYGFKVVVLEDCVGDRSKRAHDANLYDIQTKYGDVVHSTEIIEFIKQKKGV